MRIAMLLSGGVDSAVATHILHSQGHDLHLYYIRIGRDDDSGDCNADEDIEMCRLIARRYDLPLDIVPLHDEYWAHVMKYALDTVRSGLTPHPDLMCNKIIKFGFFEQMVGHRYDKTATGHYATVVEKDGKYYLGTAVDPIKDQTDFLAAISYEQLSHILFPLGSLTKEEVRGIAAEIGLPNARRKDSQGICFLGKINYNDFLRRHLGEKAGPIIDIASGKKIGTHRGYWFHTIGQRKGLGLSGGPWYVVRKNVKDNAIYVANGFDTPMQYGSEINLSEMHWITEDLLSASGGELAIAFKTRHTPVFISGRLAVCEDNLILMSEEPVQGIAPGQYAIIYTPDTKICLGSAMIVAPETKKKKRQHHG